MNELIEKALALALIVHKGQVDKVGSPYILHVLRVASRAQNNVELVTALLHDVVEDSNYKVDCDKLEEAGFPADVVQAVAFLSRGPQESYWDYINELKTNPLATRVKLYDLADNLNPKRGTFVGQKSLFKRYQRTEDILIAQTLKNTAKYDT